MQHKVMKRERYIMIMIMIIMIIISLLKDNRGYKRHKPIGVYPTMTNYKQNRT